MAVAYGQDLRDRVLAAYDRGMKTKQVAEVFDPTFPIYRVSSRYRTQASHLIQAKPPILPCSCPSSRPPGTPRRRFGRFRLPHHDPPVFRRSISLCPHQ